MRLIVSSVVVPIIRAITVFSAQQKRLPMLNKVFKELTNAVIVNSVSLRSLKDAELANTMATIYSLNKPVKVISDIAEYNNGFRIKKHIEAGTITAEQLEYCLDRQIEPAETLIIQNYLNAKQQLNTLLSYIPASYVFAEVPTGANIEHITTTDTSVKRQSYSISMVSFIKIWNKARAYWNEEVATKPRSFSIRQLGGYDRSVSIDKENVTIGCTTIPRYEIEQLALRLELSFVAT